MSVLTIRLGSKNFDLMCSEDAKEVVKSLAASLNDKIERARQSNPSAYFELLLVMVALSIQEQNNTLNTKDQNDPDKFAFASNLEELRKYLEKIESKLRMLV